MIGKYAVPPRLQARVEGRYDVIEMGLHLSSGRCIQCAYQIVAEEFPDTGTGITRLMYRCPMCRAEYSLTYDKKIQTTTAIAE